MPCGKNRLIMKIELAHRIRELPPYLFAKIDALKNEERKKGKRPHRPRHRRPGSADAGAHRRGAGRGGPRSAARIAIRRTSGMEELPPGGGRLHEDALRPDVRSGARGDLRDRLEGRRSRTSRSRSSTRATSCSCPIPGYPVYATLTRFAGGEPYFLPLRRENGFLPDLDAIPADVARRAKIIWINYPNNPTAALAAPRLLREGRRVRAEERRDRRQRPRLQRDVLRVAAALVPGDAGRDGGRHRVPLAVEDLQHDRLARRLGVRQPDAGRGPRPGEDQRRLGLLRGGSARGDRGADRRSGAASPSSARSIASGATFCAAACRRRASTC